MLTALLPAFFLAATAAAANDPNISRGFAEAIPGLAVDGRDSACSIAKNISNSNIARSSDSGRDPAVAALFSSAV